jgi:DNA-binding NtrC family response regulator
MTPRRARILVVDTSGNLSLALEPALARHEAHFARDAFDAIYRIDCATHRYDIVICDLARGDVPGPELWAYLSISRTDAARRMVFVASAPLESEAKAFLARVPNICVELPADPDAFDALARRRAVLRGSAWGAKVTKSQPQHGVGR